MSAFGYTRSGRSYRKRKHNRFRRDAREQTARPRTCPSEGKAAYYDRTVAIAARNAANARDERPESWGPINIYKCRNVGGEAHFHLGHGKRGYDENLD